MFAPAARQQAEDARQIEQAANATNGYRPGTLGVTQAPNASRLSHRKVLACYIPLCLAALATVTLSLSAATVPMTVTNSTQVMRSTFFDQDTTLSPLEAAYGCCAGNCAMMLLSATSYSSSLLYRFEEPDDLALGIGAPYNVENCTAYTITDFRDSFRNESFFVGGVEATLPANTEAVAFLRRSSRYDVPFTVLDFVAYSRPFDMPSMTTVSTVHYVQMQYDSYNTFVKPRNVNRRRVVTSPISTWHSLAELTTMIALAISGCIFAFAWSQVKELDAIHELEQTTANAVTLTPSDQYSVLGTAFVETAELVENPYGTSAYTKADACQGSNDDDDGAPRTGSREHMGEMSDDASDQGSGVGSPDSPLSPESLACRAASPPVEQDKAEPLGQAVGGDSRSTVAVHIMTDVTEDNQHAANAQDGGRETNEPVADGGVFMHEPSSPTAVRAIPISRTRITRIRRLRDLIRQYQLARVRQLALLDCVLLIVSFFLFLNTFVSSSDSYYYGDSVYHRVVVAQVTYRRLRVFCCTLSVFTLALTIFIVKFDVW